MSKKKVILSDWDDTKVDTFNPCVKIYETFTKQNDLPSRSREEILLQWGKPIFDINANLWPDRDPEELNTLYWEYVKQNNHTIKPFPYAQSAILELKKRGYILGIVSSTTRKNLEHTLSTYFDLPTDTYSLYCYWR